MGYQWCFFLPPFRLPFDLTMDKNRKNAREAKGTGRAERFIFASMQTNSNTTSCMDVIGVASHTAVFRHGEMAGMKQ